MNIEDKQLNGLVAYGLIIIGLYFPTSIEGNISLFLNIIAQMISCSIFFIIVFLKQKGNINKVMLLCSVFIYIILAFCTIASPFKEYALGAIISYIPLTLLYCSNIRNIKINSQRVFIIIDIINIILALFIIMDIPIVLEFFVNHYSDFYPTLVHNMIYWDNKPVLMFGSHSLAGFYLFLFFFINFQNYVKKKNKVHLALAFCFMMLLCFLKSVTAYIFAFIAIISIMYHFYYIHKLITISSVIVILISANFYIINNIEVTYIINIISNVLLSEGNGFLGRYSSQGTLLNNIYYVIENPLQPVGLSFSESLFFGDGGILEYVTRGSIFLPLCIYGGLFYWLYLNCKVKSYAYFIFITFFIFELGFSNLKYSRTLYLLPFFVIYLNNIVPNHIGDRSGGENV